MRSIVIPAVAAAAMFTLPAFAQEDSSSNGTQASSEQSQEMRAMSQQKLRSSLEEAGFSDVQVLDTTYLVRAKTKEGEDIIMFLNPPNMSGGGMGSDQSAQSSSNSSDP